MYGKIIEEWGRQEAALITAADLNIDHIAMHLAAQAEGYALAAHSFNALKQDHEGAKGALTILCETHRILTDAGLILTTSMMSTIADTVSACIKTLRKAIPKEEDNNGTPSNT